MRSCLERHVFLFCCVLCFTACDQTMADFPDASVAAGGECGSWYAGAEDAGISGFAVEKEATFPCFVWESVSWNGENKWFNTGEVYLAAKHGTSSAKALVIAVVGTDCVACAALVNALGEMEPEFNESAVMLALTHGGLTSTTNVSLDGAVLSLSQKGWPAQWPITNDLENHLPKEDFNGIPWVVVVRLSDMRVVERSNIKYTSANPDELLAFINSF